MRVRFVGILTPFSDCPRYGTRESNANGKECQFKRYRARCMPPGVVVSVVCVSVRRTGTERRGR
jgi:hypothetical protein